MLIFFDGFINGKDLLLICGMSFHFITNDTARKLDRIRAELRGQV